MKMPLAPLLIVLLAPLPGCGGAGPVSENANNVAGLPDSETNPPDEMTGAGDAESGTSARPSAPGGRSPVQIPATFRGTWGSNPIDCDPSSPNSDAILRVDANGLHFAGSTARPIANVDATPDFISGDFEFTAGGRTYRRFQSLQLQGKQLLRTESGPNASYTYIRCD
jgi:hypothetical protein